MVLEMWTQQSTWKDTEPETEVNERFAESDLGSSDPVPRTRDLGIALSVPCD